MKKWLILPALPILLALGALFVMQQTNTLRTTRYTWTSERVPPGLEGFCIAQLSDLHNKHFGEAQAKLIAAVQALQPDMIALTGDFTDLKTTELSSMELLLQGIAGTAPIYYVDGNHDPRSPLYPEFRDLLAQHGVTVLDGNTVTLERGGDSMTLAGYPCWDLSELQSSSDIVLYHDPDGFSQLAAKGCGLVIAGHNHGGQVALPWGRAIIGPRGKWFPQYSFGMYRQGESTMVLSRGLGTRGFPFRLFAMPEVVGIAFSNA